MTSDIGYKLIGLNVSFPIPSALAIKDGLQLGNEIRHVWTSESSRFCLHAITT